MTEIDLAPVRFVVEHRMVDAGGGPTVRVYEAEATGRELLRFDCFARNAHWHVDPGGRDEVSSLAEHADPLAWVMGELRGDLGAYLARAGVRADIDAGAARAALDRVEKAARGQ